MTGLTEGLIRKKALYPWRLLGRYYVVVIDGTGVLTFDQRHCPHCLTRTHGTKTLYYHYVLEAKLITPNGFAFSLMTEFIENPQENPAKQDCELKAFHRLTARIKERFPRLPVVLSLDGLYAAGPVFELCTHYGWKYFVVLKENSLPSVHEEFHSLQRFQPMNHFIWRTGKKGEVQQDYRWVNGIDYVDSKKGTHILSVLECMETKPGRANATETTRFKWATNIQISMGQRRRRSL